MAKGIKTRRGESKGVVETVFYLYNEGDEKIAVTGGWTSNGSGTLTKNADNLLLSVTSGYQDGRFYTNNAIDLTNFTTLKVEMIFQYTNNYYAFSENVGATQTTTSPTAYNAISGIDTGQPSSTTKFILSLNISSVSGSHYIFVRNTGGQLGRGSSNVYKIWLE